MKTITLIFLLMSFWALNGFGQNEDVTGLLEKPETRTEIFKAILNDHNYMIEFMNEMKSNDHAMMMMKENSSIIGNESKGDMEMCEQDSTMCNDMANMMSVHPHMMQMCVQRMKENGMMDSNGKIKMMDSDIPMERSTQHGHQ